MEHTTLHMAESYTGNPHKRSFVAPRPQKLQPPASDSLPTQASCTNCALLEKRRLVRLHRSTKDSLGLRVHRFACGRLAVHRTETCDLELLARLLHGVNPPLQRAVRPILLAPSRLRLAHDFAGFVLCQRILGQTSTGLLLAAAEDKGLCELTTSDGARALDFHGLLRSLHGLHGLHGHLHCLHGYFHAPGLHGSLHGASPHRLHAECHGWTRIN